MFLCRSAFVLMRVCIVLDQSQYYCQPEITSFLGLS